jgi:hypothetical protein
MSITSKTINLLQRLRNGQAVNSGEFTSAQQKELIGFLLQRRGITFTRIGKSRGSYHVADTALFQELCAQYDTVLKDFDAAARLAAGEVKSRAGKVMLFGNSKQKGADRTMKGFTILADRDMDIQYLGKEFTIGPLTGLHVINRSDLHLPGRATVVIVENAECFYDLRWIPHVGLGIEDGPFIVLCRFPVSEEARLWLESIPNRILYFGDYDLAGIRIYETEFKRRLGEKITFLIPEDLKERIKRNGNSELYTLQVNEGFSCLSSPSGELTHLITLLHSLQSGYEQEGYCHP